VHSEPPSTRMGRDCVGTTKSMADTMLLSSRTKEASLRRRASSSSTLVYQLLSREVSDRVVEQSRKTLKLFNASIRSHDHPLNRRQRAADLVKSRHSDPSPGSRCQCYLLLVRNFVRPDVSRNNAWRSSHASFLSLVPLHNTSIS
jgi:hypothetical protein